MLVLAVRPDPQRIAELLRTDAQGELAPAAPLREIVRRPGAIPALLAGQASFAVMVGVMTLTGAIVVDHQHHPGHNVFPIIGAHVVGMYALVLVVGRVVDAIGRTRALAGGLLIMGVSVISLLWVEEVTPTAVVLFGLGIGWNLSFVAATAQLADCATAAERGKLLGFNDLLAGLTGAGLALLGGLALSAIGVAALAIGGTVLVVLPALWILGRPPPAPCRRGAAGLERRPQHPQHVARQDPLGVRRRRSGRSSAAGRRARSSARSSPPIVGLMKPSKSEPIAACSCEPVSSCRRSAWRAITSKDSSNVFVFLTDAVVELVLGEDQPDHAAAGGDAAHRVVVEVVLLLAEAVAGVRGDDGMLGRRGAALAVEPVEQLEGLLQRVAAHVRDVDQHALAVHRAHGRLAELGEAERPPSGGRGCCRACRAGTGAPARWRRRGARTGGRASRRRRRARRAR